MSKNPRGRTPYVRPVDRIELSEKNVKLRWIAIVVLLAVAVTALCVGMTDALNTEPGWQKVEISSGASSCSGDFVLMYEFGTDDRNATAEYKSLVSLYTQLTEQGYHLFNAQEGDLLALNENPNTPVTVDQTLYDALELLAASGSRYPFLASVVREYEGVFLTDNDLDAAQFDPNRDPERMGWALDTAAFASDPAHICLELMGEGKVQLMVSQEYLAYGAENEISCYFDFGWMKNAFLADFLARSLAEQGFTRGYLASYDGFTRNLDDREAAYSYNLFDRLENDIYIPARLDYSGAMSIVTLRNYPLSDSDRWHYYAYADGGITSVYLNEQGSAVSSTDNLTVYGGDYSCAELLVKAAPVFLAEELDFTAIGALEAAGIHSVFAEGTTITVTQPQAQIELLPEGTAAGYQIKNLE